MFSSAGKGPNQTGRALAFSLWALLGVIALLRVIKGIVIPEESIETKIAILLVMSVVFLISSIFPKLSEIASILSLILCGIGLLFLVIGLGWEVDWMAQLSIPLLFVGAINAKLLKAKAD